MPNGISCDYVLKVSGNQTLASLTARMQAVPLDLSLPQLWGLVPSSDVMSNPNPTSVQREIQLHIDTGTAVLTAVQKPSPEHGEIDSVTLGGTAGYFGAPPIITFAPPGAAGVLATAVPIMGVKVAVIPRGGTGYTGATVATLVGGNLAPSGVPATLGAVTIIAGAITGVAIATPGSGYTTFPSIVFTDSGGGSGAYAFGGLNLVGVTLVSKGSFYGTANPPTITLEDYFSASNTKFGSEVNDFCFANWMTGPLQDATLSPISAALPQIF